MGSSRLAGRGKVTEKDTMKEKAALYARVSTTEQAQGNSVSIDLQLEDMRALCNQNGWEIVEEFIDWQDYKATQNPKRGKIVNPSGERADRPQFLAMLEQVKSGNIDLILCWRDDRLVRHPRVAVALEDALDAGDVLRKGRRRIQIHDATGATIDRFTLSIKATIWREENKRRAERTKLGKIGTLEQGRWPAGYGRLGYTSRKPETGRGRVIEVVPGEAAVVQQIYEWYDGGVGTFEIRRRLVKAGMAQKGHMGAKRKHDWSQAVLYLILRSEDYTGKATWTFADGTSYNIEIPSIIDRDLWERVQKRIERGKVLSTRNAKDIYLLQGLLKCGDCGATLYVRKPRQYRNRRGEVIRTDNLQHYYYCHQADRYKELPHPGPHTKSGKKLDWLVWRKIVDFGIRRPDIIRDQILIRRAGVHAQGDVQGYLITQTQRKLDEINRERAFYQRQADRGQISEPEFDARMEETE